MENNKITTVQDLLEIESIRDKRKQPCDINWHEKGKLLNEYYSGSKKDYIPLLQMPLAYMVRAFNKTLSFINIDLVEQNTKLKKDNIQLKEDNKILKDIIKNSGEIGSFVESLQNLMKAYK
tara:strand:- start:471 stop:833 length:363 start_codon:yes stop_codon:yes gene_type:complete